jgi:hypothetical protein
LRILEQIGTVDQLAEFAELTVGADLTRRALSLPFISGAVAMVRRTEVVDYYYTRATPAQRKGISPAYGNYYKLVLEIKRGHFGFSSRRAAQLPWIRALFWCSPAIIR